MSEKQSKAFMISMESSRTQQIFVCMWGQLGGWYFEESSDRTDKLWIWPVWGILTISRAVWDVCKAFLTEILEATGGVLAVRKLSGFPQQSEDWPSLPDRVQSLVTHCQDQKLKLGSSATEQTTHAQLLPFAAILTDMSGKQKLLLTASPGWCSELCISPHVPGQSCLRVDSIMAALGHCIDECGQVQFSQKFRFFFFF